MATTSNPASRWGALDLLRGLSVIGMLINLTPGAWEHQYSWITHAKWEGSHLIDMVAPAFLFCMGAALPLSFDRRGQAGESKAALAGHIVVRGAILVLLGLFLNAYPVFDLAHMRIPGVLQKLGIGFAATGLFVLLVSKRNDRGGLSVSAKAIAAAFVFILLSYWALLYFVPVPGFGAPRFDPVGSWPAYVDRAVVTVPHMFIYWPVDGKVVFDPDGLLVMYPSCANILLGVLAGIAYRDQRLKRPLTTALIAGVVLMLLGLALYGLCPIIKNIWTSTYVLFSGGFSLVLLVLFSFIAQRSKLDGYFLPLRVFGANPLLAYLFCFLFAPVLDLKLIATGKDLVSPRGGSQMLLAGLDANVASFIFALTYLAVLGAVLWLCYRRRWFLKL